MTNVLTLFGKKVHLFLQKNIKKTFLTLW